MLPHRPHRGLSLPFKRSTTQGEGSSSWVARDEQPAKAQPQTEQPKRLSSKVLLFDEDYRTVIFGSLKQFERFQCLKLRQINSTQYLDPFILQRMGIYDDFVVLFRACGLQNWLKTHKLLTYEFLNSISLTSVRICYICLSV